MNILFVCATEREIKPLLKSNFFSNRKADLLITGPGIPSTVYSLTKKHAQKKYNLVLNAGICGSFHKKYRLGDVVSVTEDCFSDLGAEDGNRFIHISEMNIHGKDSFPLRKKNILNKTKVKSDTLNGLHKVKGITVNTVHGNARSIAEVKRLFNPGVETMEGAAVFYVCMKEKIPCIQLRAVSNYVERRNKRKWKTNEAINNLCIVIEKLFEEIG